MNPDSFATDDKGARGAMMKTTLNLTRKAWLSVGFLLVLLAPWGTQTWAEGVEQGLSAAALRRGAGMVAALTAIVVLILVEFVFREKLSRGVYYLMLLIGLFFLPSLTLMNATSLLFEETEQVSSCASCHTMTPFVSDLHNPQSTTLAAKHYTNRWIADHQCYTCHTSYGIHGAFRAKLDSLRHWWRYVTGTWTEPILYKGSYPNANCLVCHGETPRFKGQAIHQAQAANLATDGISCLTCHGPPHPPPKDRASAKEGHAKTQ
jgi:nitrate/TMAO reductase-like tetraheme cytochrome c subunit